jgi:hypothetical protein
MFLALRQIALFTGVFEKQPAVLRVRFLDESIAVKHRNGKACEDVFIDSAFDECCRAPEPFCDDSRSRGSSPIEPVH